MEFTIHGYEHIQGRTRMRAKDVLFLLSHRAGVSLGKNKDVEFFLFFSPPDRACKIALVSENPQALISVWNENFKLPKSISPVTDLKRKGARLAYRDLFPRRGEGPKTPEYRVMIRVCEGERKKPVYKHEAGVYAIHDLKNQTEVIHALQSELEKIIPVVDTYRMTTGHAEQVWYEFLFFSVRSGKLQRQDCFYLAHKELRGRVFE